MAKFKKGVSGNPNGRPKGTKSIEIPEDNKDVMRELALGYAMDTKHPKHHEYLMKFMDKMFASLKATDVKVDTDSSAGFIYLPQPKPSKKVEDEIEEEIKKMKN